MSPTPAYEFETIRMDRPVDGVAVFTLERPDRMNATNATMHRELAALPGLIDADESVRVGVVTGAGKAFCVGGDWSEIGSDHDDYGNKVRMMKETMQIISGLVEMETPLVSAINGPAAGIGLAIGLLADISIANEDANLSDGHVGIGLAAGDHAALVWPLLCSLSQAKRYLMTGDKLTGKEAERIGLVSEAVPANEVLPRAMEYARKLVSRSPLAVQLTRRALNHWLRVAMPAFEASLGYEMVTSFNPELGKLVEEKSLGKR